LHGLGGERRGGQEGNRETGENVAHKRLSLVHQKDSLEYISVQNRLGMPWERTFGFNVLGLGRDLAIGLH
jgi:hypothetical protein